eukprot:gene4408-14533_t
MATAGVAASTGAAQGQASAAIASNSLAAAGMMAASGGGGVQEAAVAVTFDQSLLGSLVSRPDSPKQWAQLLALTALSPAVTEEIMFRGLLPTALQQRLGAVAEEIMFRGLLVTALQQRLGRVDAAAVCAALFAASHLDIPGFFGLAALGAGAGFVTLESGSVFAAIALHTAYNVTALVVGAVLQP